MPTPRPSERIRIERNIAYIGPWLEDSSLQVEESHATDFVIAKLVTCTRLDYSRPNGPAMVAINTLAIDLWRLFRLSLIYPIVFVVRRRWRARRRADRAWQGRCPDCGYDLTANESGTCPECGHDWEEVR